MQFTSSVDQPSPLIAQPVNKPDLRPSAEFTKRTHTNGTARGAIAALVSDDANASEANNKDTLPFLRFPPLFSNDLGASAFLYPTPSVTNSKNYSEGLNPSASNDGFSIVCPTELHLDEILNNVEDTSNLSLSSNRAATPTTYVSCPQQPQEDVVMQLVAFVPPPARSRTLQNSQAGIRFRANDYHDCHQPPSSAASHSSFDNYSAASSVTSNSARPSVDYPFSISASGACGNTSASASSNANTNELPMASIPTVLGCGDLVIRFGTSYASSCRPLSGALPSDDASHG